MAIVTLALAGAAHAQTVGTATTAAQHPFRPGAGAAGHRLYEGPPESADFRLRRRQPVVSSPVQGPSGLGLFAIYVTSRRQRAHDRSRARFVVTYGVSAHRPIGRMYHWPRSPKRSPAAPRAIGAAAEPVALRFDLRAAAARRQQLRHQQRWSIPSPMTANVIIGASLPQTVGAEQCAGLSLSVCLCANDTPVLVDPATRRIVYVFR